MEAVWYRTGRVFKLINYRFDHIVNSYKHWKHRFVWIIQTKCTAIAKCFIPNVIVNVHVWKKYLMYYCTVFIWLNLFMCYRVWQAGNYITSCVSVKGLVSLSVCLHRSAKKCVFVCGCLCEVLYIVFVSVWMKPVCVSEWVCEWCLFVLVSECVNDACLC